MLTPLIPSLRMLQTLSIGLLIGVSFSASAGGSETSDINDRFCADTEIWQRKSALSELFRNHYWDFDKHSGAYMSTPTASDRILNESVEERIRIANAWHERAMNTLVRLGNLLPRLNRPLDLPALIYRLETNNLKSADNDEPSQSLKFVVLQDIINHAPDAQADTIAFLRVLNTLEGQTDAMRTGDISAEELSVYFETLDGAEAIRKSFRAHLKAAVFDDGLQIRLLEQLTSTCAQVGEPVKQ